MVYANRLKTNLDSIISETQSGFLKARHISNNIRLVLDLLDCADSVHSNSLILFLDFYKVFDTIEHQFLLKSLKLFGFGCLPVTDLNNDSIENIPIKSTVKYLGIYITKNLLARQHLNFSSRIVKSKNILNSWLQRDLSLYGRVLLSKAEGLSHFVYPSLSLFVENKVAKEINHFFLIFFWKNKPHKLKKEVLSNSRADGGIELLDFSDNKYF